MQLKALLTPLVLVGFGTLAACGSSSPAEDAVEVVIEPGITAIGDSEAVACTSDLRTLQTAIDTFTLMNGEPPDSETDLVPSFMRSDSQHYDLDAGRIVPTAASGCPTVDGATSAPTGAVSGAADDAVACDQERVVLEVAAEAYLGATGAPAATEADLVPTYLGSEVDAYDVVEGAVVPSPDSTCA